LILSVSGIIPASFLTAPNVIMTRKDAVTFSNCSTNPAESSGWICIEQAYEHSLARNWIGGCGQALPVAKTLK